MASKLKLFLSQVITWSSAVLCFGGCQTSPIKEFEKISLGHDKADVLEFVGGPSWRDRRNGFDRWTYIIYQDGIRLERQIHFLDGLVTYKGEPVQPFISAEEQDAINAEKNLVLDRMERDRFSSSAGPRSQESSNAKLRTNSGDSAR